MIDPSTSDRTTSAAQTNVIENNSPIYSQAINDSRFVKSFGIAAVIYALISIIGLSLLGGGIGVGIGLFITRYDTAKYYRVLGIIVIIFAIIGSFLPFLGAGVLSGAILGKGIQILKIFSVVENKDEEWVSFRKRALIGTVAGGAGLGISLILLVVFFIGLAVITMSTK